MDRSIKTSLGVPLGFILVGILALLTGLGLIIWRPEILATYHYNQRVIAVTHLVTLGWICSVVMGSVYQLVPVALETKLYSERLAVCQFLLHLVGFVGMVRMFWVWDVPMVATYGSIMGVGVLLFVYNIGRTLLRIPRWNIVAVGIASALGWLVLTIIAGLLLAAVKLWPVSPFDPISQMHAHAHLGGLGFFIILIVAVSYKLIPMFLLSDIQNHQRAWATLLLLNMGMAGLFVTLLFNSAFKLVFAGLVITGLLVFGWELNAIVQARKRRVIDWSIKYFLTAIGLLIPVCLLAIGLSWPGLPLNEFTGQLETVYGLLALLGVITLAIMGMLYKIVPFLIWYSRYSSEIGRSRVPSLADLYSVRLQAVGYWIFLAGLILTTMGTMLGHSDCVQRGGVVWFAGITIFAINIGRISFHLVPWRLEVAPVNATPKGAQ